MGAGKVDGAMRRAMPIRLQAAPDRPRPSRLRSGKPDIASELFRLSTPNVSRETFVRHSAFAEYAVRSPAVVVVCGRSVAIPLFPSYNASK